MAIGQKTGGRQKGTPNKATAAVVAEIAASGETPLAFMLRKMRDTGLDDTFRMDAAKAAAPYVHPKLAATEVTGKDGSPLVPAAKDDRQLARAILEALADALPDADKQSND